MVAEDFWIDVSGWPPVKNEATSMLAGAHPHADRVLALLRATRDAAPVEAAPMFGTHPISLELVVRSPKDPPSDATNYLGGVGDVLEAKDHRGILDHLGDLANVALYANDRQIHQVAYRWERSATVSYTVRIKTLI